MELFTALEILFGFIVSISAGLICGLGTYFLDFCFWEGNIFKNYLPWLARTIVKRHNKKMYDTIIKMPKSAQVAEFENEAVNWFWYKPLGGCSVCMHVWISMITWTLICIFFPIQWYFFFPYMLSGSWILRKLVGAVYQ